VKERQSAQWHRHRRYAIGLTLAFAGFWLALAIAPADRADWALENVLVAISVPALALSWRSFPLSRVSYTLIFLFLCLHTVGAHYAYSEVPYDAWSRRLLGFSLNEASGFQRNHFDRFVHFCYGLLLAYPARELFFRIADARGFWAYFLPLDLVVSTSALFELFEWAAAVWFGGDLGVAYLGTQGDEWDAQKDMALAALGATIAMGITMAVNLRGQRDFSREWWASLRVKRPAPLGEVRWAELRSGSE
jgi:putative membrane protein